MRWEEVNEGLGGPRDLSADTINDIKGKWLGRLSSVQVGVTTKIAVQGAGEEFEGVAFLS